MTELVEKSDRKILLVPWIWRFPPALLILSSRYNYGVKHNLKQAGKYAVTTVLVLVLILVWVSTHRQMEVLKQAEDLSYAAYSSQPNRTNYARLREITETEKQQE